MYGDLSVQVKRKLLPPPQSLIKFISNFILQNISKVQLPRSEILPFSTPQLFLHSTDSDGFSLTIYVPNLLTLLLLLFCERMPFSRKHCFLAALSYLCRFIHGPSSLLLGGLVCAFLRLGRYFLFLLVPLKTLKGATESTERSLKIP